jgi:arylsulfatase A-like enzyme
MKQLASGRFWRGPWPWVAAAAVLGVFAVLEWRERSDHPVDPRPPGTVEDIQKLSQRKDVNVLFILVDTLRASHLHNYGYPRPTSPFLDSLANQGLRFTRHLSQSSWTKCSMASLWTGLYPQRSGVTRFDDVLSKEAVTAAEVFRKAGFRTAGIWRNGWVESYFGFDQGFDLYVRPGAQNVPEQIRRENPTLTMGGTDLDIVAATTEFLRVSGHERWFLYLHLMDVHEYTYGIESAKFGSAYLDVYDNAVLHVNRVLDQLFSQLYLTGHLTDTIFIVAADHGEAFAERGSEGHARNVYPEVTEVPLIMSFPFRLTKPIIVTQRTANVDLWPTVFDMLGLPPLENVDGRSRMPEILAAARGEAGPDGKTEIAHLDQSWGQRVETTSPNVAVSDGPYRYIMFRGPDGKNLREELFDFARDPRERENQLEAQPEVAKRLREDADLYLASKPTWNQGPKLGLDELQLNQLRALGYSVPRR